MARPAMSVAVRATSGAARRQGPHQAAQKSTRTGTRAFAMISSKSGVSTSNGSSIGGSGDLQLPQRPVSARCSTGTRFFWPQFLQTRTTGIKVPQSRALDVLMMPQVVRTSEVVIHSACALDLGLTLTVFADLIFIFRPWMRSGERFNVHRYVSWPQCVGAISVQLP